MSFMHAGKSGIGDRCRRGMNGVFLADDILEAIVTLTEGPPFGPTIWGLGSSFRGM